MNYPQSSVYLNSGNFSTPSDDINNLTSSLDSLPFTPSDFEAVVNDTLGNDDRSQASLSSDSQNFYANGASALQSPQRLLIPHNEQRRSRTRGRSFHSAQTNFSGQHPVISGTNSNDFDSGIALNEDNLHLRTTSGPSSRSRSKPNKNSERTLPPNRQNRAFYENLTQEQKDERSRGFSAERSQRYRNNEKLKNQAVQAEILQEEERKVRLRGISQNLENQRVALLNHFQRFNFPAPQFYSNDNH